MNQQQGEEEDVVSYHINDFLYECIRAASHPHNQQRRMVDRIENGQGRQSDLDMLDNVAENIMGRTICALGDAAAMPVRGMLKHFRSEFEHHIEHKCCAVQSTA